MKILIVFMNGSSYRGGVAAAALLEEFESLPTTQSEQTESRTKDGDFCDLRQREWSTELLNWLLKSTTHWDRFLCICRLVHEMSAR